MDEIIHSHVFNPNNTLFKSSRNERARHMWIECSGRDRCGLFSNGQCSLVGILPDKCPYGSRRSIDWPTRKSSKFLSWIKQREELYGTNTLKEPVTRIAEVGEHFYLPYNFMPMNADVFPDPSGLFSRGSVFLHKSLFTIDHIIKIIKFRPQALFGGEITDYQKKIVPLFTQHLQENMPSIWEQLPKALQTTLSPIGRKARLSTLRPGCSISKGSESWTWDGAKLTSANHKILFPVVEYSNIHVEIVPDNDASVIVESESQVCDSTIFVD